MKLNAKQEKELRKWWRAHDDTRNSVCPCAWSGDLFRALKPLMSKPPKKRKVRRKGETT